MSNKNLSNSFTTSRASARDHHHVNEMAAATGNARGKGGLFPFRRRTLCNENDSDITASCSVSSFQQVFNEVKAENPLSSMGAVQQMTVRRLSELKKIQKHQQEGLNSLAQDGHGDARQIGLAGKALNTFVDIIRIGSVAPSEGEDHGIKAKGTCSSRSAHKSHLDDSFVSSSSSDYAHDKALPLMKLAAFRRNSSSTVNRRSSQLSSAQSALSDFNSSNDSLTLTKPRTANEMYAIAANEQGENMALLRSVDDFSVMLSVGDLSRRSGDSLMSDMSSLFLEELVKYAKDAESGFGNRDGNACDGVFGSDFVDEFILAASIDNASNASSIPPANCRQEKGDMIAWGGIEKSATTTCSNFIKSNIRSIDKTRSCQSDALSALSGLSDCTSACGSDGLIVGFPPQCNNSDTSASSNNSVEEDDDFFFGSEGFAADFSAWESKCER